MHTTDSTEIDQTNEIMLESKKFHNLAMIP